MINQLVNNIKKLDAPIVVGLDPMLDYVPEYIKKAAFAEYGETLEGAAEAIWQYNKGIIDATYDLIPAVKPQIAIGHVGKVAVGSKTYSGFCEDFVTVNPYLGSDGIRPFMEVCKEEKKGMFILVKTSNPSSGEFQDQEIDGKPLYEMVAEKVASWGEELMEDSYSYIGAVVGATYPKMGEVLRKIMPKSYILVPGYGAQGGQAKDLAPFFNEDGLGAIINSSRGIICAYKQDAYSQFGEENYADASRQAVLDMKEDLKQAWVK